jgi:hypothetical protein
VTGFCGDSRAVTQLNFFPDTEQVLEMTGFPGFGDCSLSGPSTVLVPFFIIGNSKNKKIKINRIFGENDQQPTFSDEGLCV